MLDKIILGFLKIRPMTGYDIKKVMERSVNHVYSSSLGSINPALRKLEEDQAVVCRELVENHRSKKIYSLTAHGEELYAKWLEEPINTGRIKEEALVRLFFLGDAEATARIDLIKGYLGQLEASRRTFRDLMENARDMEVPADLEDTAAFQLATLEYGIDYLDFSIAWFRRLLKRMEREEWKDSK